MDKIERRENPRKACSVPVYFSFKDKAYTEFIRNISDKGMYIDGSARLSPGREIILGYRLPGQDYTKRPGLVVRKSSDGMGIQLK